MENDSPPLAPLDAALAVSDALPLTDAVLDAHGFDPGDYDWVPIPRRHRTDGWTHAQQRAFIEALADLGSVRKAAAEVRMSARSAYALRRAPGAEGFAAAWDAAIAQASKQLIDVALDRAFNGLEQFAIDKEGNHIYTHIKYNDRLLMFLLRAHQPERFGLAATFGNGNAPDHSLALAIEALAPIVPPEPHRLMAPDKLAEMIEFERLNLEEEARFEAKTTENKDSLVGT